MITWDALGERQYEIGVDRGVFYSLDAGAFTNGIAWNGLTGVDSENGGREGAALYSGGYKVGTEYSSEEYSGKIKCYLYPDEFEVYLGEKEVGPGVYFRQQDRDLFGFCYRSLVGNDTEGNDHGYKIHLIYNCLVTDLSCTRASISDNLDVPQVEISFETFPVEVSDDTIRPVSEIILDSRSIGKNALKNLEYILYGHDDTPRLPYPDEIIDVLTIPEPMPEEWYKYPNTLLYPAETLYPQEA